MSRIIRAKVETNSSEDSYARVKISADGVWNDTPLVESIGGIPLKKGDYVFVDASTIENPLIIGRAMSKDSSYGKSLNGSLLFESSDGSKWTIGMVKNNKLEIANSDGVSIVVDGTACTVKTNTGATIALSGNVIEFKGSGTSVEIPGLGAPDAANPGPFCALPTCPFTGAPHSTTKVTLTR